MDEVPLDGWYRLAAAVVRGIPKNSPDREAWRQFGSDLDHRLTPAHRATGGRAIGHMERIIVGEWSPQRRQSQRRKAQGDQP